MCMDIKMAFFEGDDLLASGEIHCRPEEQILTFNGEGGHSFEVRASYEEPAIPIFVTCSINGQQLYRTAIRMGVHTSDDWESVDLGNIHTLVYKCYAHAEGDA